VPEPWHGRPASAVISVPPLAALWLVHDGSAGSSAVNSQSAVNSPSA
jgi:hypothetical protein